MKTRRLGRSDLHVSAMGLGCFDMTGSYGSADEQEAIATIHRALELGINFLDTADSYGPYTNELLVGRAIQGRRDQVVLASKFGREPLPDGTMGFNSKPEYVHRACEASLQRLGVDCIDLYYQHRVDVEVPIEETVGAMADLVEEGKVRYLGLSEASAQTIRRAHAVHPITAVESEYSLFTRDPEDEVLPALRELGISLVAFSPLGRGFLTGALKATQQLASKDHRKTFPRFTEENFRKNVSLAEPVIRMAKEIGCTPAQVALAWLLAQGEEVIPIPGTKRRTHLEDNASAADLALTEEQVGRLSDALPRGAAAGERHAEMHVMNQ